MTKRFFICLYILIFIFIASTLGLVLMTAGAETRLSPGALGVQDIGLNKEPESTYSDQIIVKYHNDAISVVDVPAGMSVLEMKSRLLSRGDVTYVEDNQVVTMAAAPNDAYYSIIQKKSFDNMAITEAWDITGGSSDIVVAILDTGVDFNHPDLAGKILSNGYNYVGNNSDPSDDNGHGTMCAGIVAACIDNSEGIAGATQNCMILPVKVLDSKGNGSVSNIAAGIIYAADNGADVINLSLGCPDYSQTLQDAVNYAHGKGIIVIAATGNTGGAIRYPAACQNAVAVGAVTSANEHASYSNYGSQQSLVAVGSGIFSTTKDGGYSIASGTSYAAPFVSSLAALLLSENRDYTPDQLLEIMKNTAKDLGDAGWDQKYGYGCINFNEALKYASEAADGTTGSTVAGLT